MNAKHHRLYFKLQVAAHTLQKQADTLLLETGGITTAQAAVLTIVGSKEAVTQRELALLLKQNESAITAMIARLQNLNLIKRIRSKNDGRAWSLHVTAKGKKAVASIKKPFEAINQHIENAIGKSNIEDFATGLTRLADFKEHDTTKI